MYEMMTGTSF